MSVENVMYVNVLHYVLFLEPTSCSCENGKYLAYIHLYVMDYSANTCDKIIEEETKTISANFNEKKATRKILLALLFITIVLLIAVSTYCYLIKYRAKQKHLLPFYDTNNELKQVLF